jgi:hypothetical protein
MCVGGALLLARLLPELVGWRRTPAVIEDVT